MERRDVLKGLAAALGGLVMIPGCKKQDEPEMIASCYMVMPEYIDDYVCSICGNTIKKKYSNYLILTINNIEQIVNQIMELDYDVVLDKTEFCPYCNKKNIENPELIFKIRFSEEADYHIVRSNIVNEYYCLSEFLSNPDEFLDEQDEKKLQEKITIIKKMTGLGDDLKIE